MRAEIKIIGFLNILTMALFIKPQALLAESDLIILKKKVLKDLYRESLKKTGSIGMVTLNHTKYGYVTIFGYVQVIEIEAQWLVHKFWKPLIFFKKGASHE